MANEHGIFACGYTNQELKALSLEELRNLYRSIKRISDVGYAEGDNPYFWSKDNLNRNAAGDLINRFTEFVDIMLFEIAEETRSRVPTTSEELEIKTRLLIAIEVDGADLTDLNILMAKALRENDRMAFFKIHNVEYRAEDAA